MTKSKWKKHLKTLIGWTAVVVIAIVILLFFSCNKKNSNQQESEYVIKVRTDKAETLDYSKNTIFNKFISLETTDNSLIRKIEKIYFHNSIIIIFDESLREIFLFDNDGSYIGNSCKENKQRIIVERIISEWIGKEIYFSADLQCNLSGKDTCFTLCSELSYTEKSLQYKTPHVKIIKYAINCVKH